MNISFVIITDGQEPVKLRAVVEAIRSQDIPRYEIIIVGDPGVVWYGTHTYPIRRPDLAQKADLGAMRNLGCATARYDCLVVIDDDIVLQDGWYQGLLRYDQEHGGEWDVLSCKIRNPDGSRYWDWKAHKDGKNWLVDYKEHPAELSLTGGLTIMRRYVWQVTKWIEGRGINQEEDVDYTDKLKAAGWRIDFNRYSKVVHDAPYTQAGLGVYKLEV